MLQSVLPLKKVKREAAAQRRPAQIERKNALFPRNDRPYGLKCKAFQTENALIRLQIFPAIYQQHAILVYAPQDAFHGILRNGNAAFRVTVVRIAVEENGRAFSGRAFFVVAYIQAILIGFFIVDKALALLPVERAVLCRAARSCAICAAGRLPAVWGSCFTGKVK